MVVMVLIMVPIPPFPTKPKASFWVVFEAFGLLGQGLGGLQTGTKVWGV